MGMNHSTHHYGAPLTAFGETLARSGAGIHAKCARDYFVAVESALGTGMGEPWVRCMLSSCTFP